MDATLINPPPAHTRLDPALAHTMSDRAFRLYASLVLHGRTEWTSVSAVAQCVGMSNHQVRGSLAELRGSGLIRSQRKYVTGASGRRTSQVSVRLTDAGGPA
ncbi:Rrf2 family transcriptional regulator [Streptomyces sp. SID13666]|uniref:Rrf2 family transcriptional regulator n=1 Tax=Streptomyces sp. SID13666 TaxID=2706054 RepID=UPI0013C1E28C|nr:Rrf2 family transcriptional regulator [Streptomyces sp. SID13666]NEA53611.1 Rrf2 family transcriptional regulator [Streptomyces sp. SID13666]